MLPDYMRNSFQPRGTHPATSNTERQREFRERNPGYYGRLHRKRKAERLAHRAGVEFAAALTRATKVLMLPAPVETIEIPGMTFPVMRDLRAEAVAV